MEALTGLGLGRSVSEQGGKIRLGPGNIGLLGSGAHRAGREDPSRRETLTGLGREDPSWSRGFNSYSKERVLILTLTRGAHRAGVGRIVSEQGF